MRSKEAFAYSRSTGSFCSVAMDHPGRCRRVTPQPPELVTTQRAWSVMTKMAFSAGGDGGRGLLEHDDLERWCGGWALPWHRADLGLFGAHALSRCARVTRMDSCGPLLATHFLLEKQVRPTGQRPRGQAHTFFGQTSEV